MTLYGELLIDFINAETPDEAFESLFSSIQKAFSFSPDFVEKCLKLFPPLRSIEGFLPMTAMETSLMELLLEKMKLEKKSETMERYLPVREEKVRLRTKRMSEKRFEEIEQIALHYSKVAKPLRNFDIYRKNLRTVFDDILNGKNLYENNWFRKFFNRGMKTNSPVLELMKDGAIVEMPSIRERSLLRTRNFPKEFGAVLAYCAAEFLKTLRNRKRIHRCEECSKFSISKTAREQRFCCDKCRLRYHNRRRIESGEARKYKAKKRIAGAKESYYG
jgi:hypothetical protein